MKRLGFSIIALGLLVVFTACSSGNGDGGEDIYVPPDTTDVTGDVQPDTEPPPPDTVDVPDTPPPTDVPDVADVPDTGPPPDEVTPPDTEDVVDIGPPPCSVDVDCDPETDFDPPLGLCELARCINGGCVRQRKDRAEAGGEASFCEQQYPNRDVCDLVSCDQSDGSCVLYPGANPICDHPCALNPALCDDANPCTTDTCDAELGCQHAAVLGAGCSDSNPCTNGDVCVEYGTGNARCGAGAWNTCDDANPCTVDWCDPTDNDGDPCQHQTLDPCTLPCNDDGDCPDIPDPCRDYVCKTDLAEPVCEVVNTTATCDDQNACTSGDVCANGVCTAGTTVADCDDGDFCTRDSCDPTLGCINQRMEPCCEPCAIDADCDAMTNNPCVDTYCDGAGCCRTVELTRSCNDGNLCTEGDQCGGGVCNPGDPVECDDGDPATRDFCEPATGCGATLQPLCGPVGCGEDTDCCTEGADCDDGDPCTIDSCLAFLDPSLCLCEPVEFCSCNPNAADGGAGACDDGDPCTADTCNPNDDVSIPHQGLCEHEYDAELCCETPCAVGGGGTECDDGNKCTQDLCEANDDGTAGCCTSIPFGPPCGRGCSQPGAEDPLCAYGDECVRGVCGAADNTCDPPLNDPELCECTAATYVDDCADLLATYATDPCVDVQCVDRQCTTIFTNVRCIDVDQCTVDSRCSQGECVGQARTCDDGNDCTVDSCDPATGCSFVFDAEIPGCEISCASTEDCNDHDPCTQDVCVSAGTENSQCQYTTTPSPTCIQAPCTVDSWCDDGNPCTGQQCVTGRVVDGVFVEDPLEEHACVYGATPGCEPEPTLACVEDSDCQPGDCVPDDDTLFPFCVVDPTCTTAVCAPEVGCVFVPGPDCVEGCRPDIPDYCEDGNPCTVNTCNIESHVCEEEPWTGYPGDVVYGNLCVACDTAADCYVPPGWDTPRLENCFRPRCNFPFPELDQGACFASTELYPNFCEDYEVCTTDACGELGCENENVVPNCEICSGDGDCDDLNPCTVDTCAATGLSCTHAPITGCTACTTDADCDSSLCTLERCDGGRCVATFLSTPGICVPETGCTSIDSPICTGSLPAGFLGFCDVDSGSCLAAPDYENAGAPPCTTVDDCFTLNRCRRPTACTAGACTFEDVPDCTPEVCATRSDCDDSDDCTINLCTPFGCVYIPSGECCETNADCLINADGLAGLWCFSRACAATDSCIDVGIGNSVRCSGVECTTDADCPVDAASYGPDGSLTADWDCSVGACDLFSGRCIYFDGDCVGCAGDTDCADTDPCTADTCSGGTCVHEDIPSCTPTFCDETTPCDSGDTCQLGICLEGGCVFIPNPHCL